MSGDKLLHYYPGAQFNWSREGDWTALEWQGPGEQPTEAEFATLPWPVAPVPDPVTTRQAKLALFAAGMLDAADAALAQAGKAAQIEWEYAVTFERSNPLIAQVGGALGLTEEQIDDLFRAAAAL